MPIVMFKRISPALLFAASALFNPIISVADESPQYSLGDILVTANYEPWTEVGTEYTLDQSDFQRSDARTLDQALRQLPSINVRNGADGTPRIDIRGLRTRQIKLLVNGIPFNSADDGQFDPTLIPIYAIGRIRVMPGATSVLLGDGGMGGAIDIQTRTGLKGLHSGAQLEAGTDNLWHANAYVGGGDEINDFFISAGVVKQDGFRLSDDFTPTANENGGNRENSDRRRSNLMATYDRQVTDFLHLGVFLSHVEGHEGHPPSVFTPSSDPFANTVKFERIESTRGTSAHIGADFTPAGNWSGRFWFYTNALDEDSAGYDDANYNTFIKKNSYKENDKTLLRGYHAQLNGTIDSLGTQIAVITDNRDESLEASGFSCSNANNNKNQTCSTSATATTSGANNAKVKYSTIAINKSDSVTTYATELDQPLFGTFGAIAGLGYVQQEKDNGSTQSAHTSRIGLYDKITAGTKLYGTAARKVDTPTIRQLYDAISGNANLQFEEANHLEIGSQSQWNRAGLNLALYRSRIHNFIEMDNTTNQYQNRPRYLIRGIDASGNYKPTDNLTLTAAVGLMDAQDKSPTTTVSTLQYRPRNKANLAAEYRFLGRWSVWGSLEHTGTQAYYTRSNVSIQQKANLDSYDLVFTQIRYQLPCECGSYYLGADNLLDKNYSTSYGFPQAGRFIYTGVQLNW